MLEILGKQITGVTVEDRAKPGFALGNVEYKNGVSSFSFEIPQCSFVSFKAYTLGGKEIAEISGAEYAKGRHALEFGHKAMPTGTYILKMKSGYFSATRSILVGAN
jgi:hypothetical protein